MNNYTFKLMILEKAFGKSVILFLSTNLKASGLCFIVQKQSCYHFSILSLNSTGNKLNVVITHVIILVNNLSQVPMIKKGRSVKWPLFN